VITTVIFEAIIKFAAVTDLTSLINIKIKYFNIKLRFICLSMINEEDILRFKKEKIK
jgi:hypothetical protein